MNFDRHFLYELYIRGTLIFLKATSWCIVRESSHGRIQFWIFRLLFFLFPPFCIPLLCSTALNKTILHFHGDSRSI
jgi:hypothetical protein